MTRIPAILLATGAAFAAPAFAERVTEYTYAYDPATNTYIEKQTVYYDQPSAVVSVEPAVTYVSPTVTYTAPAVTYYDSTPVTYVEAPIVVTAPYMTRDEAITLEVMDRIAEDTSIRGRVGVDTYRDMVTLTGRVGTPGQAEKAQRHAQNTPGVREVDNQIRARVGG